MELVKVKTQLSKKEEKAVYTTLQELTDLFGDFYITQNNLRLFIKENMDLLLDNLKKGDKIAFDDKAIAVIVGFSDNANRKYIKVLAKDRESASKIIKVMLWHVKIDLYAKLKKNNPLVSVLKQQGFVFAGGRGKEILLKRTARESNAN